MKYDPILGEPSQWCQKTEEPGFLRIIGDYRRFCPYGGVGDRLWIREAFCVGESPLPSGRGIIPYYGKLKDYHRSASTVIRYRGNWNGEDEPKWRPSIFMPRWACRTVVEITGLRVERLQCISQEGAIAEGIELMEHDYNHDDFVGIWKNYDASVSASYWNDPIDSFHSLWVSINGRGSWEANPWVWVISFNKVEEI